MAWVDLCKTWRRLKHSRFCNSNYTTTAYPHNTYELYVGRIFGKQIIRHYPMKKRQTKMENLEKRIQALEDIEAIKKLKSRYAQLADGKYSSVILNGEKNLDKIANEVVQIYAEDAIWDSKMEEFKTRVGRSEIYEHFAKVNFNFSIHYFTMPDITVNGDSATGRWYLWNIASEKKDGKPILITGFTDDEYAKIDGRWLFKKMTFTPLFIGPYDQGWVKTDRD